MFDKLINVYNKSELILLTFLISITFIACAPISSKDELCSVNLVPNQLIAKRFQESIINIRCEATLESQLSTKSFQFTNPVFDLSFGGAPRTGVFIIRGNATCDPNRVKCWSEYKLAANSIGHLIQHSGDVVYSCKVADQIRSATNKTLVRCESKGYLGFTNTLKYGDSCSTGNIGQECDINMDCLAPDMENESENEKQCICRNGFTPIPLSNRNTVCLEEVSLGLVCNYTKQCSAIDSNSVCERNAIGLKVCQCSPQSYPFSEYETDYIKKCIIKPKTTTSPTTEEDSVEIINTTIIPNEKNDEQSGQLLEVNTESKPSNDFKKTDKNDKTGNVGIVLFFVAIILSILIVIIIIRARNKSDKMVINKKRTIEQQTDDKDGEQSQPILTTDNTGVDEVDDNTEDSVQRNDARSSSTNENEEQIQINNKINTNINNNEPQKIQTNKIT